MNNESESSSAFGWFRSIGPAIIVASVVLGPGSILTSTKVGTQYGYDMVWALATAAVLMIGMTALAARLGVVLSGTPCDELAARAGRPLSILVGLTFFLIVACFQFGNNVGVLAALEPWVGKSKVGAVAVLVIMNAAIIFALFGFRHLYKPVEKLMKLLVALMIVGFAGNLIMASPSLSATLGGLLPQLPEGALDTLLPKKVEGQLVDHFLPVQAMFATTFSVAGAFYQAYLVRQKGWTVNDLKQGLFDSAFGISALALTTLMLMITAAAVLHDNPQVNADQLKGAADVAVALEPLFGRGAVALFTLGLFAGAFSSFLMNAMIGGTLLSDGLGLGGEMDQAWPKAFTVAALLSGMTVAILLQTTEQFSVVDLIVFAQALTVLGNPLLAGLLLWLAARPDLKGDYAVPLWLKLLGGAGFLAVLFLAVRTAFRLYLQTG